MYLKGYIERLGTGTADIVRIAKEEGLKEPEFIQDDSFKTILYRPSADQVPQELRSTSVEVGNLIKVLNTELSRKEIQQVLGLKHKGNFRENKAKKHRAYYPACKNRCRPILEYMLEDTELFTKKEAETKAQE
jgi:predicted HTH transcriptional regulator